MVGPLDVKKTCRLDWIWGFGNLTQWLGGLFGWFGDLTNLYAFLTGKPVGVDTSTNLLATVYHSVAVLRGLTT